MEVIYTVYVLFSAAANMHYYGYTSHLLERMKSHNHLGKDWTARHRPWLCIYTEVFWTKQEALQRER